MGNNSLEAMIFSMHLVMSSGGVTQGILRLPTSRLISSGSQRSILALVDGSSRAMGRLEWSKGS